MALCATRAAFAFVRVIFSVANTTRRGRASAALSDIRESSREVNMQQEGRREERPCRDFHLCAMDLFLPCSVRLPQIPFARPRRSFAKITVALHGRRNASQESAGSPTRKRFRCL